MNSLDFRRKEMVDALKDAGLKAYDVAPERFTAPAMFFAEGDPFMEAGNEAATFQCKMRVRHTLTILVANATNNAQSTKMTDLITKAVLALNDFGIDSVSAPFVLQDGAGQASAKFLAVQIEVSTIMAITES